MLNFEVDDTCSPKSENKKKLEKFCIKNMKKWSHLPCIIVSGWLYNSVRDIFLTHLGLLMATEHPLDTWSYLDFVADHVHPRLLMAAFSRITEHVTKLGSWMWDWTQVTSTITRSQSNRAPSHNGRAVDKSAATFWCHYINMEQILLFTVSLFEVNMHRKNWLVLLITCWASDPHQAKFMQTVLCFSVQLRVFDPGLLNTVFLLMTGQNKTFAHGS